MSSSVCSEFCLPSTLRSEIGCSSLTAVPSVPGFGIRVIFASLSGKSPVVREWLNMSVKYCVMLSGRFSFGGQLVCSVLGLCVSLLFLRSSVQSLGLGALVIIKSCQVTVVAGYSSVDSVIHWVLYLLYGVVVKVAIVRFLVCKNVLPELSNDWFLSLWVVESFVVVVYDIRWSYHRVFHKSFYRLLKKTRGS